MYEAETEPARSLWLMTFRDRVGPAALTQGQTQVALVLEGLWV